jgi:hypothetical protein
MFILLSISLSIIVVIGYGIAMLCTDKNEGYDI